MLSERQLVPWHVMTILTSAYLPCALLTVIMLAETTTVKINARMYLLHIIIPVFVFAEQLIIFPTRP